MSDKTPILVSSQHQFPEPPTAEFKFALRAEEVERFFKEFLAPDFFNLEKAREDKEVNLSVFFTVTLYNKKDKSFLDVPCSTTNVPCNIENVVSSMVNYKETIDSLNYNKVLL
jgi:hypothetical protein